MKALNILTNVGTSFLIGVAINAVSTVVDNIVNANKKAIEAGREAATTIASISDTLKTNNEYIDSNAEKYAKERLTFNRKVSL